MSSNFKVYAYTCTVNRNMNALRKYSGLHVGPILAKYTISRQCNNEMSHEKLCGRYNLSQAQRQQYLLN